MNNMLINIGEAYIVVNLLSEDLVDNDSQQILKLKVFGGENNGFEKVFLVD